MHPFVHPSSCSHSCIAEPTVLCLNAAGNHLHPTMLLSPRQAAASCFYTRLSSAQWHRFVPPKALQPCRTLRSAVVTAASSYDATIRKAAKVKASNSNAMRVRAAFAEAGLSQDAIDHILTQYPHYLRWDVEQKLLPAMQQKRQESGYIFLLSLRELQRCC